MYSAAEEASDAIEDEPTAETEEFNPEQDVDYWNVQNSLGALDAYGDMLAKIASGADIWDSEGNIQLQPKNENEQTILNSVIEAADGAVENPQDVAKRWIDKYITDGENGANKLADKQWAGDAKTKRDAALDAWYADRNKFAAAA